MIIEFDKSFVKSLDNVNVVSVNKKIEKIILAIEACKAVQHISHIKKLSGFTHFYRIRIGDYRIGLELINDQTIRFIVIAHRKGIYKHFP